MAKLKVERLRALRETKGWTIRDLAQVLGCEVSTPARWEHGKLTPRPRTLERLADIFHVDVEELIEPENISQPKGS